MSIMQMLLAARGLSGYLMDKSLRFRASASAFLNRTPSVEGNRQVWTWSAWVKRGQLGGTMTLLAGSDGASSGDALYFSSDTIGYFQQTTGAVRVSTAVYRDPSAWYHIVAVSDSTNATAQNRFRIYVNGVEITAWTTNVTITQNRVGFINANTLQRIANNTSATQYFDGYLAEVNFVNAQALTPASFGETNALTGVWQPKAYTGTYGTNGFYLKFTDNSTAAALGTDFSGNSNTWTVNNISVTAGVTYDSMTDVPTLTSDTAANYAVLNPLSLFGSGTGSLTNANLTLTSPGGDATGTQTAGSIAVTSGKYYFEGTFTTLTSGSGYLCFGVQDGSVVISGLSLSTRGTANTWWISDDGNYRANGGTITASGLGAFSAGQVAMIAIDASTGKGWIGKQGTWVGDPAAGTGNTFSSLPTLIAPFAQAIRNTTTSSVLNANFGQRPFAYTPPTGFKALNTYNLLDSAIVAGNKYFDATAYTGTGSIQSITNSGSMQPDLLWIKGRSRTSFHDIVDSVRGVNLALSSNSTAAEVTGSFITSLNSNGFTLPANTTSDAFYTNVSGDTMVAWQWKAGGTAVTNTAGTISAQVSASPTSGFSVVTYTGNASIASFGHGLGVAPKFIIIKNRTASGGGSNWCVGINITGWNWNTDYLYLNSTIAKATDGGGTQFWSAPTSTVVNIGGGTNTNGNTNSMVAYCWSEIDGFSKFGSYTGNGSADGPFVYLGFRPKYVLLKRIDTTGDWQTMDGVRSPYNQADNRLWANLSNSETANGAAAIDILSNGFKFRSTASSDSNASGGTYIYAAFAESPFKNSLAR